MLFKGAPTSIKYGARANKIIEAWGGANEGFSRMKIMKSEAASIKASLERANKIIEAWRGANKGVPRMKIMKPEAAAKKASPERANKD